MPFMLATLLCYSSAAMAGDDAQKQQYNIPAQPLADALRTFSEKSGLQLLYDANLAAGKRSAALRGAYLPQEALGRLLAQSGLEYRIKGSNMATLVKPNVADNHLIPVADTPEPQSNGGEGQVMPKVMVEADADNPYDDPTWQIDPYNRDYVLPKATAGTKTNTPIMETPLNVQVISKQVLKDQQVISLDKALRNVSGVNTYNKAGNLATGELAGQISLRGFPTQTIFRNGFRMDKNGSGQQFANVESVEVLKGPAAILYGRVEPGGMVNIVTKQPRATPYYSFNQQFGSYDLYRTSIDATGPLTKGDTLQYRVNASFQSNNSFRDLVSGEDVFFAPILKWNISPKTQATLEMEYNRSLTNQDAQILPFNDETNHLTELSRSRNLGGRNPIETENIFVGFNWSHQFNYDWSIKHQVAFRRQDSVFNLDEIPFQLLGDTLNGSSSRGIATADTYATNLDLTGHFNTWGLKHTLLLGGDYYRFDTSSDTRFADTSNSFSNPVRPALVTGGHFRSTNTQNTDNYGLYLQDQIKLPYDVHVTGGLRYQYVHSTTGGVENTSQTDDAVTPRVGILWQPKKWLSLYSNYAENFGANTGAFSFGGKDLVGNDLPGKPLPPESAQQWEIGAKTELFDGRLRATLAYYDLTKQNVATSDFTPGHSCFGGGVGSCSIAVGEVRSRGPELDIQGEILPGWNVIATYANQDVRVTKSTNAGTSGSLSGFEEGNRLQFVPRNTGSVWTTYEVQQGDLKGFQIGGGVNLQDSVVNADNTFKSPGFALVGLMTGYSFDFGKQARVNLQLNIDNLLDKSYISNASPSRYDPINDFDYNIGYVTFSTPRTFMGSINVEY
ncbi:MAG: TonB-dependent receptor [Methyloglobulus sp.]|nr:TonB-dependent receptor [Methyloglobulus sp.]